MKKIYTLILGLLASFGFSGAASAQCGAGEVDVYIDVTTDSWGNEIYWELVPTGDACGGGSVIFVGGNTAVGCAGGCAGANPAGGYANSSTITEGPFCLIVGQDYDIIFTDDYGDGIVAPGGFEVYMGTSLTNSIDASAAGCGATYTFTAIDPPGNNLAQIERFYNSTGDSTSARYYTRIPVRQAAADTILLGGEAENRGTYDQPNTKMTVTVSSTNDPSYYLDNSNSMMLNAGNFAMFDISNPLTLDTNGTYVVDFTVSSDSVDEVPTSNTILDTIIVNDTIYGRDNNVPGGGYWYGAGQTYQIGNLFEIHIQDTATSLSYYNLTGGGGQGAAGSQFFMHLCSSGDLDTPIETVVHTVTASEENSWIHLPILETELLADSAYVVLLETVDDMLFTQGVGSPTAPPLTSFVNPDNTVGNWFYTGSIPFIRLNTKASGIGSGGGGGGGGIFVEEISSSVNFTVYPNPNSGEFSLAVKNTKSGTYVITVNNILGQQAYTERLTIPEGSTQKTMDLTGLEKGVYFFSIKDENSNQKMVRKIVLY